MDDVEETLKFLTLLVDGAQPAKLTTYTFFMGHEEVTVNVLDRGEAADERRFSVEAYFSDLPVNERQDGSPGYITGYMHSSLEMALHMAHWDDLRTRN
ncbi:hypothetical protein [Mycetocola miduiensis]|uniref:Uncharacterized protein n=1 Tax=Mycetocola miduiensis TaxID=995034 RepID=A0A1I5AWD1_9MICO|nr:hypothetical protein [Mycetocola miduiensis]SFN66754.1 hypothetical protein SAMN05216219_1580 [Mycetocola miduiensis]